MYTCVVHVAKHIHESTWKYMTSPTCTHVNSYWRVHHVNTRMGIECVFVCMMCVWVCVCFVMFIAICKHMYTREYTSIHPIKAPHVNSYEELLWDDKHSVSAGVSAGGVEWNCICNIFLSL